MISIAGNTISAEKLTGSYPPGSTERDIIQIMSSSSAMYSYSSINQLKFELLMRRNIVNAAVKLANSRLSFRVFKKSKCNSDFWERTGEGGFLIKEGIPPSLAINDIYIHSFQYGTECATAIVITFCKAVVDAFPAEVSNKLLSGIYLMNWQHLDPDLGIGYYRNQPDYLPGDCRYFKNPDADPETPEWQGENAIDLSDGMYYGHGIGITNARTIIRELNKKRVPGSDTPAFLVDAATRPDFRYLAGIYAQTV